MQAPDDDPKKRGNLTLGKYALLDVLLAAGYKRDELAEFIEHVKGPKCID